MSYLIDLHLHSKYSRATSKDLDVMTNAQWARWKGIDVVGTGDFTHPEWLKELKDQLVEDEEHDGLLRLSDETCKRPLFLLTTETSHIYSHGGKTRRVHLVTLAPDFKTVETIQDQLLKRDVNITSDGRPIMGLSCQEYMDLVLTINEACVIIPAHIWTPWYAMFGSMSGYDSIEECFGPFSEYIYAIETGLSSDPMMNWQIKELDSRSIVSFSDAHSPSKLGREVTIIEGEMSYGGIVGALKGPSCHPEGSEVTEGSHRYYGLSCGDSFPKGSHWFGCSPQNDGERHDLAAIVDQPANPYILATLEFYPQEGKYHYNGHRKCEICWSPQETQQRGEVCPRCGKQLTLGVEQRVTDLAIRDISEEDVAVSYDENGVRWINTPKGLRPGYAMLVPLQEIISEVKGVGVKTKTVQSTYTSMITTLGTEFEILLSVGLDEIGAVEGPVMQEAIRRVRCGEIAIDPGYDGEYGVVSVFGNDEDIRETTQSTLF